jgi:hypothetical protein
MVEIIAILNHFSSKSLPFKHPCNFKMHAVPKEKPLVNSPQCNATKPLSSMNVSHSTVASGERKGVPELAVLCQWSDRNKSGDFLLFDVECHVSKGLKIILNSVSKAVLNNILQSRRFWVH